MKNIKCGICGGEAYLIHKGTRDRPDVNVYECESCKTKQLDLKDDNDYENGFMNGGHDLDLSGILSRLENYRADDERRFKAVYDYARDKDVCDFGCGFGGFLSRIKSAAKSAYGVEAGRCERGYLKSINLRAESKLENYKFKFDVITLFHVFEHLAEPKDWLNKFAEYLKPNGYLFIEVPNANDALLSLYNCKAFADFTYWSAHLYLYNEESLSNLIAENNNFEIEEIKQVQRYNLANHLGWICKGSVGGDEINKIINSEELNSAYATVLAKNKLCDTLLLRVIRK